MATRVYVEHVQGGVLLRTATLLEYVTQRQHAGEARIRDAVRAVVPNQQKTRIVASIREAAATRLELQEALADADQKAADLVRELAGVTAIADAKQAVAAIAARLDAMTETEKDLRARAERHENAARSAENQAAIAAAGVEQTTGTAKEAKAVKDIQHVAERDFAPFLDDLNDGVGRQLANTTGQLESIVEAEHPKLAPFRPNPPRKLAEPETPPETFADPRFSKTVEDSTCLVDLKTGERLDGRGPRQTAGSVSRPAYVSQAPPGPHPGNARPA
jgi:hypothetical protein